MMITDDGLDIYLKDVSKYPVLTREEEVKLFNRLGRGDESVREEIIRCNLRLVVKLALPYQGQGMTLADLIQEGNMGLMEVVDRFKVEKGFKFSTYAAFWIKQAIQQAVAKHSRLVRLPIRKSQLIGKIKEASKSFIKSQGRSPEIEEISLLTNIPEEKVRALVAMGEPVLSLDSAPTDGTDLMDSQSQRTFRGPLDVAMDEEMKQRVRTVVKTLDQREQRILALRYGFNGSAGLSLRSTSRFVGLSQEGVRRIEKKALEKMAHGRSQDLIAGLL